MDLATLLGLITAFSLVVISIMMGGPFILFVNIPSLVIVAGGTIGATFISYPMKDVFGVIKIIKNAFFAKTQSTTQVIGDLVQYASKVRKDGILSLQETIKVIENPFITKGLQLVIDGLDPNAIKDIMDIEVEFIESRHKQGAEMCSMMGTTAPAMGLIGTLIGLVQMLQNMEDPSSIGPAMAVALLTTFYGAVFANIVFNPLASKLQIRSKEEVLTKELIKEGIICIAQGDNPRIIEQKLHSYISPNLRVSTFE